MIAFPAGVRVWLATGHTDMRRGFRALALLVQETLKRDPHAGDLFVFRGRRGQLPTFCIPFSFCDDRLSLAPLVRAEVAGIAVSSRQGIDMHLHGRAARPLPGVAELDVRRELLLCHDDRASRDQH
jgi:transposase